MNKMNRIRQIDRGPFVHPFILFILVKSKGTTNIGFALI